MVKNLPASAGDMRMAFNPWVRKIPLEEEMETHSSILAGKIPWTEESGQLQYIGLQRVRHDCVTNNFTFMGQPAADLIDFGVKLE